MRLLFVIVLALFLSGCFARKGFVPQAHTREQTAIDYSDHTSGYRGMSKKDLAKAGYTKKRQLDYYRSFGREYITFDDCSTEERGDIITFVIENKKVIDWLKREKNKDDKGIVAQ